MSSRPTAPRLPLARLDRWLPGLDGGAIARILDGRAQPSTDEASVGVFSIQIAAHRLVEANVEERAGPSRRASVGLTTSGDLVCHCACADVTLPSGARPCRHVVALLRKLGSQPALRERLAREAGSDTPAPDAADRTVRPTDRARALGLLRQQGIDGEALARRPRSSLLELTFRAWRRRGDLRPLGETTFYLGIDAGVSEDPEPQPGLKVRVQPAADRRPFGPDDLETRRLPAREWRLFEFLSRTSDDRTRFAARGRDAAMFLDRAVAAKADLRLDGTGEPIRAIASLLRPALRVRQATLAEVAAHPMVAAAAGDLAERRRRLTAAWHQFSKEAGPLSWDDFLRLLAIPEHALEVDLAGAVGDVPPPVLAIEAVWTGGDGPEPRADVAIASSVLLRGPRSWVFLATEGALAPVDASVGPIALARLASQPLVLTPASEASAIPALLRAHFHGEGVVLPEREALGLAPLPRPRLTLRLTGSAFSARATLEARYDDTTLSLGPQTITDADDAKRNAALERAAIDAVGDTRLRWRQPSARRRSRASEAGEPPTWAADGDDAVDFWTRDLPALVRACEIGGSIDEIVVPPSLKKLTTRGALGSTLAARSSAHGVMAVALGFAAEGISADLDEIRQALEAKRRWVKLTDGSVAELSDRVTALALAAEPHMKQGATDLPVHAIGEVAAWRDLADESDIDPQLAKWADRFGDVASLHPEPVPGLEADLRAYQQAGVAWLQLLAETGTGGVLADDMGLGKTVQALALLAWRRARDGGAPSLVVAPTSVALNWIREAERFTPGLRAILLHGADRHAHYDAVPQADLVVTTYALLRRDYARLRDVAFRYVILDEAQQIKNHAAATTAAAKSLRAEARLALTGTPIENRLLELWSILDFCNPGMLGSWRAFQRRYEGPVEGSIEVGAISASGALARPLALPAADHAASETSALRARIRPFLLRRTKGEVQRDLPPKIESDVAVELTPAQRRAYAALAAAVRADLAPKLTRDGLDRHRMQVLTALLRLRQMACDPRLVDPRHRAEDSAKLLALRELTAEVVASGRRALVFSQFVELLTLVRTDLEAQGIRYAYLDGRTRHRQRVIDGFVEGTEPLFLLSLRAGGTGINLAAADVVIHLDPWWNPAVEEQATDRAHRIGQTRTVSVYRLIAAGTIEEAIMRLKAHKRALASTVIGTGSLDHLPLTADEVDELLHYGA